MHLHLRSTIYMAAAAFVLTLSALVPVVGQSPVSGDVPGLTENPLSEHQKQRIASIRRETEQAIIGIQNNVKIPLQEKERQSAEVRKRSHGRILAELTPAQRQEFKDWWQSRLEIPEGVGRGPSTPSIPGQPETSPKDLALPMLRQHPLTSEQKQMMEEIRIESRQQAEQIEASPDLSAEEKMEMLQSLRRGAHERFVDLLTVEQLDEMIDWLSGKAHMGPESGKRT